MSPGQVQQRVLVDGFGTVRLAVTAHIWSNGVEACLRQRVQLMTPGVP